MKSKAVIVKLFTRPTIKGKRTWEVVNLKDEYPEDTVFYLRWLPRGAKNYSVKALPVNTSLHDAQVKCVSFSPQPVVAKPTSANKSQTLAELRKAFLEDKRTTIKSDGSPLEPNSLRSYELVTVFQPRDPAIVYPVQVTRQSLKFWIAAHRERVSHRTVCKLYTLLSGYLRFCGVDKSVLLPKGERPTPVEETPEAYSQEEMTKFFFNVMDERDALAFEFLLKTGAREREMTYFPWAQLNLDANTVTFRTKDGFRTKTGKTRTVPLERGLAKKLAEWRVKNPTTKLVFGDAEDKPYGNFWYRCWRVAELAGMNPENFWLHKFRDTFATWALRRGVDIRTVQHWLGHSSIAMTQRYLAPQEGTEAQRLVNQAFGPQYEVAARRG